MRLYSAGVSSMASDQLTAPLMCVPIFKRLSPVQIDNLSRHAERIVIPAGDAVIRASEQGDAAFLLIKGDAVISQNDVINPDTQPLPEGTFIGEIAMLTEIEYVTTVIARSDVRALKFSREMIRDLMRHDPELAAHFVETLRLRMVSLASKLRQIDRELSSEIDTPKVGEYS